ncbi:MAG: hypothetical protein ACE5EX_10050 [Phycisphaerae bacterium]
MTTGQERITDGRSSAVSARAMPCPRCGYDLRGHGDPTRCPECGRTVSFSAAASRSARWIDGRLLDLWSVAVLQGSGCLAGGITILAIWQGHYIAVMLGLMAAVMMAGASMWFIGLAASILVRSRRPFMRTLWPLQIRRLARLCVMDAILVAVAPAEVMVLAWW